MGASAAHAAAFYDESARHGSVWTVRDAGGVPAPLNGSGRRAMPFWSLESRADAIVRGATAYTGFEAQRIPLEEFRERWLPGLARDGLLVGLNWSGVRATGYDVEPREAEAGIASRLARGFLDD
jgi:hypothetical protein